ncbi:MAG: M23 family metallopeptidase [Magnetococcales bacterium]|nr:M23 family metallopeptidase [Magnetococcales bacterium]
MENESNFRRDIENLIERMNHRLRPLQPRPFRSFRLVVGLVLTLLSAVSTIHFSSVFQGLSKSSADRATEEVRQRNQDAIILSALKFERLDTSRFPALSDLSPTLDSVSELFSEENVKNPSFLPPDPRFHNVIDSLILSYLQPMDEVNIRFKKSLLQEIPNGYPVDYKGVTSPYGDRIHPILGEMSLHRGIDLRSGLGNVVVSTADGVVSSVRAGKKKSGLGRSVSVQHNHGFMTRYGHLQTILVKPGDFIKKGQIIARSGQSGLTDGPHLHYEVHFLNQTKNPQHFLVWDLDNFDALFQTERDIQWSTLIDRLYARLKNMEQPSVHVVKR